MEFLSNSIPILGAIPSNTFDPHNILCRIDTIAPLFFVIGVISALLSHGGYEFIGGMATRGKTRPSVPTSTTTTSTSTSISNSSSSINSTAMNSSVSPPKRQSPLSSSIKTAPSSSSSSPSSSRLNPSSTTATGSHQDWFKSFLYGDQWSVKKSFFLHYYIAGTISLLFLGMVWWWDGHDYSGPYHHPQPWRYIYCV